MRLTALALAALLISGPAAAQFKEYAYVPEGFAIAFPSEPDLDIVDKYEVAPGKTVPANIYSVRHNNVLLKVTVADGRDANLEEESVMTHAVSKLTQGGEVKFDFPHRIYRIYGRQMSVERTADRTLTQAVLFVANERLYLVESTKFPGGLDSDMIQFQQSLTFDRNVPNRTPEQMAAMRAACTRGVAGTDAPGNPAGVDDPRCAQD